MTNIRETLADHQYTHLRVLGELYEIVVRIPDEHDRVVLRQDGTYTPWHLGDLQGAVGETPYRDVPPELWFERTRHSATYWYGFMDRGISVPGLRGGDTTTPRLLRETECAVYVLDRIETVQPDPDLVAVSEKMRLEGDTDGDDDE